MKRKIIIGSRGSELALWQAKYIQSKLEKIGQVAELKIINTKGDKVQDLSFDKMEGKGFFTKELEEALLKEEIDLAVHSHKDLPTANPPELIVAAVSEREDPSELILINRNAVDEKMPFSLKHNAVVGTSSARRKSQLLAVRGDIEIKELRGNVPTRVRKLKENEYDAIVLAFAGTERLQLDLEEFHIEKISPKEFVPAPAQGALAVQVRDQDIELKGIIQQINQPDVSECIAVERKVLSLFEGGCQLPLGVYCEKEEDENGEPVYKVWTTKAEKWNALPVYLYTESKKTEGLAEKIVDKLKNIKPCSIYISRDPRKHDLFSKILSAHGFSVFSKALIEIVRIPLRKFRPTDWIFFGSKNAVHHFFAQKPEIGNAKFAAVGMSTSRELRKYGKQAEFIGNSTDTRMIGKQFASLVGSKIVLFPQAKGSMKTIQQQFPRKEQIIDIPVYETILQNQEPVPFSDVLVFTSPSNVEAFFEKNKIQAEQKVIAMGSATANELKNHHVRANKMPETFDDFGLLQAVFAL